MNLGENIYRFRTEKNMSQGDLADALDVSRQSVSKWENNSSTPELEKLIKMSDLFGISLDELVSGKRAEPKAQTIYGEKPHHFSKREQLGLIFWCFAALLVLAFALAREGLTGLVPAVPLIFCGCFFYFDTPHPGLDCCWALCIPLMITFSAGYVRSDFSNLISLIIKIPLFIFTLRTLRNDPVELTKPVKLFLLTGYLLWFGYILWFLIRHFTPYVISTEWAWFLVNLTDVLAFALFTGLLSVTTRLLRQKQTEHCP